ncbi:hypothetical protein [Xenorhabdus lircayensis]|uniref:Transposase n=1 Tax=Xenorhabdus lircayensis TaxID=2763499 RepID=A0ABS0U469_9GAMM|nr:hypothetical protein [Xenorhabdus lircayensis]MBI6547560.1 hypothetical protein [Xenorhabdus lircayensis]
MSQPDTPNRGLAYLYPVLFPELGCDLNLAQMGVFQREGNHRFLPFFWRSVFVVMVWIERAL